jgi:hypothetical protein
MNVKNSAPCTESYYRAISVRLRGNILKRLHQYHGHYKTSFHSICYVCFVVIDIFKRFLIISYS